MNDISDISVSDGTQMASAQQEKTPTKQRISLPRPKTVENLEQLLYRYGVLLHHPQGNEVEKDAIEKLLEDISSEQEAYNRQLESIRHGNQTDAVSYDGDMLGRQLLALQLLERDLGFPDGLINTEDDMSDSDATGGTRENTSFDPIKVGFDFNETAKNLGLGDAFASRPPSKLGEPKIEQMVSARIAHRIRELETLPANLGSYTLDSCLEFTTGSDLPSDIDKLKMKAIVELKSLKLLTKQKSLRQKLISRVANHAHHNVPYLRDSPFTMAAQRSVQIRSKVIVPQTARIAEELERQQLLEKRKKERNLHVQKLKCIREFMVRQREDHVPHRERCLQFGKSILSAHGQMEKDEQKRIERTAKQRLAALKSNDEEAYLKLLDQTKDTRITQLLKQTNSFLDSLARTVRIQQNEAKLLRGEEITPITEGEREKLDYYEVTHRVKEKIDRQPSILVGGTLKEYQLRGLEWMVSLYNNNLNGILADEMGLGKTIQSISLITYLIEVKKNPGPYLVIVPLSTITNWSLEFEKWAPSLTTIIYKGTPNQRKTLQHQVRGGNFDVLLTTYEYIIKDRSVLDKPEWAHMIIDEGHRMKNVQSKLSSTLQKYYRSRNRLILTGTPLQNNLPELWALLNFVLPKIFNSAKTFEDWFNTPFANTGSQERLELTEEETLLIIRRLHKVLRPFLLRRLKKEVEKDLPDKVEKVVKCKLSGLQQQLYQQMLKYNALFVGVSGSSKSGVRGLNNRIMQLRKICNHPFLFDEVENVVNPSRGNSDLLYRVSGKFELLDRVLPKLKATGHRVLIFFQMTHVMDIMEDFLRMKGFKYMRLDGSTKTEDRTGMLKLFNDPDSDYFCFLLSTRAGGLGLNLQSADTVIIFDTDWNPHQDLQAQDRAHRIGQKNEVRILRLITSDSVEEAILERAMQKLDIDGKVIQAGKFDNKSTAEEQEAFLRRLLESEARKDDDDKAELDDDELNEILARSDEEKVLFAKIDEERVAKEEADAKAHGLKAPLPRLIQVDELPAVFTANISDHLKTEPVALGRIRQTKRVYYDDGLTEEQFLEAIENEEETLDEVVQRKREARARRMLKKRKRQEEKEKEELHTGDGTVDGKDTVPGEDTTGNDQKTSTLENSTPNDSALEVDTKENIEEKESTPISDSKAAPITTASQEDQQNSGDVQTEKPVSVDKVKKKRGRKRKLPEESKGNSAVEVLDTIPSEQPDMKKPRLRVKLTLRKSLPAENSPAKDINEASEEKPSRPRRNVESRKSTEDKVPVSTKRSGTRKKTVTLKKSSEPEANKDSTPVKKEPKIIVKMKEKSDKKVNAERLLPLLEELFGKMRELTDGTDGHPVTEAFEKLPSKRMYPDYYQLIEKPIALDTMLKSCKKGAYATLTDLKADLDVMYNNARFYNEEDSWVFIDANKLNDFTDKWFEKKAD